MRKQEIRYESYLISRYYRQEKHLSLLASQGAIFIKEIKGRKKKEKRHTRRRQGSIRKSMKKSKGHYVILTRKLRKHLAELRRKELLSEENYLKLRKEIRASAFKSKSHLRERITGLKK